MKRLIAFVALVAGGLGFLLFPQASQWFVDRQELAVDQTYVEDTTGSGSGDLFTAAQQYNTSLAKNTAESFLTTDDGAKDAAYQKQLHFEGTDVMATVEVASADIDLPIYHGTSEKTLLRGAGHLYGSSLPVGGPSTHAVITAHSGMPDEEFFTPVHDMKVGDQFMVTAAGHDAYYRVDKISTVLPTDVSKIQIVPGKDYVTLATCTPIGINTHRLLVRGVRIADPAQAGADVLHSPF
ncbi:MAG: class C sortase, partial [Cellulomonadaceae bacterium]|nr:class C sortase [Cellulomonadaceae bacterium]